MEIRSASAASVVLLLLSLSSFLKPSAGATAQLFTWDCPALHDTYYPENSTYQSNVRSLLASLAANASRSESLFATAVVGASPDNMVWGLGLCRGDVTNATECASCLALAPEVAFDKCMGVKDVSIFYDRCIIRYSFRDFLTTPDFRQVQSPGFSPDAVNPRDAGWYDALVVRLVDALANRAAFNTTSRYAAGVMDSDHVFPTNSSNDVVHTIYGLVQCTPNQTPGQCRECLKGLIDDMPALFNGSVGGHIFATWCNLRFEKFEFYDGGPMLRLVAPQPTPPSSLFLPTTTDGTRWRQRAATVSTIVLGVAVILLSVTAVFLWRNKATTQLSFQEDGDDPESLLFDLTTLRHSTHNFAEENKLGHGGFGAVYKVPTIAPEIEKRLLLRWETRYRIIYGTTRGLLYLHEDSQIKIIHRDLKASNILLDTDMNPKISDFGLAKLFNSDRTSTITGQVVGTLGYMAPEYAFLGHLSVKLDVYSFGVVVLEIVTGRKNTDMFEESSAGESGTLLNYVWDKWSKGTALATMDPTLDCKIAEEGEVLKCIHLGLLCVQENPADRPTMLDVLVMLHGHASSFVPPSKPAFTFASSADDSVLSGSDLGVQRAAATPSVNEMSVSEFEPR